MASKKTNKKKSTRAKSTTGRKARSAKKHALKGKIAKKAPKKVAGAKKAVARKKGSKKTTSRKNTDGGKIVKQRQGRRPVFPHDVEEPHTAEQSGDLQGLSRIESADSESVDELLEEGNAFEAGVVSGIEDAGDDGEREVHTREVLEDDVPSEYLDEE
jgi:hypothetical protein